MCKKVVLAFVLLMLTSLLTKAQDSFVEGDFKYRILNNNTVELLEYMNVNDIVMIPGSITHVGKNYIVKSVADKAFINDSAIVSLEFPNSITTIGDSVGHNCAVLSKVVIGDGTTVLGAGSFSACPRLSLIVLGKSLNILKNGCFKNSLNFSGLWTMDWKEHPIFVFRGNNYPILENYDVYDIAGSGSRWFYGMCPLKYKSNYDSSTRWTQKLNPEFNTVRMSYYTDEEYDNALAELTGSDTIIPGGYTHETAANAPYNYNYNEILPISIYSSQEWTRGAYFNPFNQASTSPEYEMGINDFSSNNGVITISGTLKGTAVIPVYLFTPKSTIKINLSILPYEDGTILFPYDNGRYETCEGGVALTRYQEDYYHSHKRSVKLPEKAWYNHKSYDVVAIKNNTNISAPMISLELPNSVISIGDNCTISALSLNKLVIGEKTKIIGKKSFNNPSLQLIILGDSLEKIGSGSLSFTVGTPDNTLDSLSRPSFVFKGQYFPVLDDDLYDLMGDSLPVFVFYPKKYEENFINSNRWTSQKRPDINFVNMESYTESDFENSGLEINENYNLSFNYGYYYFNVNEDKAQPMGYYYLGFIDEFPATFNDSKLWNRGFIDLSGYHRLFVESGKIYYSALYSGGSVPIYLVTPKESAMFFAYTKKMIDNSDITEIDNPKSVVKILYYNLHGIESSTPFDGINIIKTFYNDGTSGIEKRFVTE